MGTQYGLGTLHLKYSIALAQIFLCHSGQVTCVHRSSIYHLQNVDNVFFFFFSFPLPSTLNYGVILAIFRAGGLDC